MLFVVLRSASFFLARNNVVDGDGNGGVRYGTGGEMWGAFALSVSYFLGVY